MMNAQDTPSTRPYLVRALYEWCTDNGFTPYVAVRVDDSVRVPREYVKNGEIVLNISFDATSSLKLGNEFIEFKARFAGVARDIMVPMKRVIAIYARETGQGMAFPVEDESTPPLPVGPAVGAGAGEPRQTENNPVQLASVDTERAGDQPEPPRPAGGSKPALKRVK
jgi:stringent starvation protein B